MKEAVLGIIVGQYMVLLGERLTGEIGIGTVNAPGGKVNPGESLFEALEREVAEELCVGIDEQYVEYVGTLVFHSGDEPYMRVYVYRITRIYGTPSKTASMKPLHVSRKWLPYNRMLESDAHWFGRMADGEHFNANIFYREAAKGFIRIEILPFDGNPKRLSL